VVKGFLTVFLAMQLHVFSGGGRAWEVFVALTVLGVFLGHLYPIYFKGRYGGKGVATAAGCFLQVSPAALLGVAFIFILMLWCRRVVSMGSLAAAGVLPILIWILNGSPIFTALGVVVAAFIWIRHSGNIRRLRNGTEPRI
jgi:glycerol-3-phosphate acyltransferase PlsY